MRIGWGTSLKFALQVPQKMPVERDTMFKQFKKGPRPNDTTRLMDKLTPCGCWTGFVACADCALQPVANACLLHLLGFISLMAFTSVLSVLSVAAAVDTAWCQAYVGFDAAVASNTYAPGDFAADKAMSSSSGYWCRCWSTDLPSDARG